MDARDLTEYKAELIRENARRLGAENIRVSVRDASVPDGISEGKADVLIADLPCSGLGVLGKKTDLKYRMTREQQEELAALQRNILSAAQAYVKPGGTLVYSTCTIGRAENEENVRWFLEHFPYEAVSLKGCLPEELTEKLTGGQTLPESFAGKRRRRRWSRDTCSSFRAYIPATAFLSPGSEKKMDSKSL